MASKQSKYVTGRPGYVLDQKIQIFQDRRTKRNRDRSTERRTDINRSIRDSG